MLKEKPETEPMPVVHYDAAGKPVPPWPSPVELRKLPQSLQKQILAASAELAEEEYRVVIGRDGG